jgi:GNAT superfamily N-acetyltransferase
MRRPPGLPVCYGAFGRLRARTQQKGYRTTARFDAAQTDIAGNPCPSYRVWEEADGNSYPPITDNDLNDCGRICYEGFRLVNERHGFPPGFSSIEAGVGRVHGMLQAPSTYGIVAEADASIVGFAFLTERDPVRSIGPIAIDPRVQSRGIGRRLMGALLERARGASSIRLVQAGFNLQSLSLYATLGFDAKEQLVVMAGRPRQPASGGYSVRRLNEADVSECEALHRSILGYTRTNELRDRLAEGSPIVAIHEGRVAGYLSAPTGAIKGNFGVAESDEAMEALLSGAAELDEAALSFILPTRHANLFRWCLGQGFLAKEPMTLMSIGEYFNPQGIQLPSLHY